MGEPQPVSSPALPRPPGLLDYHTAPLPQPSAAPQRPSSQSTKLTPARATQKVIRKPKGITKIGLKQSMELHGKTISRVAYNTFRVQDLSGLPSFTNCLPFQDTVRSKMKEKGTGIWLVWDDVPTSYKDWLVNEVSELCHFYVSTT